MTEMVIKNSPKVATNMYCESCDYICSKPSDYTKHLSTAKHKKQKHVIKNSPKVAEQLICEQCDYVCSKQSDMIKHRLTIKHINRTSAESDTRRFRFDCYCGKQYVARTSLYRHQRTCRKPVDLQSEPYDKMVITPATVVELLHQNEEFKRLLIDQNKQLLDTQEKIYQTQTDNIELHKQLVSALNTGKMANYTTNNHTTNHHHNNQKFNLNFFLNTTCKDAINMSEFIETIEVQMSELENIGHNGYVAGMTDIILSRIKDLDVSKRPVHCTDLKRETMYIKDQNEWNKETPEKSYLRKAIDMVSKKNYGKTMEWREDNPECLDIGSAKYDFCFKMMRNVLGDFEDVQVKLDNKIIKNLAKEVVVDR